MATFCDMAYTWDANKNKTSESITGVMSGYGFTAAGTTYDNEDLCFSSSLPPPASSLLIDIDANGTADVNFQYDALGRRIARTGTIARIDVASFMQRTLSLPLTRRDSNQKTSGKTLAVQLGFNSANSRVGSRSKNESGSARIVYNH